MSGSENQVGVLGDECEKYLTKKGMYSIGVPRDDAALMDIYTIDGELVTVSLPRDISEYLLDIVVTLETQNSSLAKELNFDAVASKMIASHPITSNETQEDLKKWTSMNNAARGQGFKVAIAEPKMADTKYKREYFEHETAEVAGFSITDATSTGLRPHDDLIWVGYRGEGRWLQPDEALALADSIKTIIASHVARHK
jgi:hypothetical protein